MNKHRKILNLTLALILLGGLLQSCGGTAPLPSKPGGLDVGDPAYDFSLVDNNGQVRKMSDLKEGWYLVLILYRGSWCSACQEQLANLKDDFSRFTALHATIMAVSTDSTQDSSDYNQQWRFPFPLLSDPELKVIEAYGARHPKGHAGRDIARPTTIIIDPKKIVRFKKIGRDPTDRPTDNEILSALQEIQRQDASKKN